MRDTTHSNHKELFVEFETAATINTLERKRAGKIFVNQNKNSENAQ